MATRPTFLPNWGTTGPKLKPPSGKAAAGYSPGEEPSAQWDNYREDLQRQWIEYQRDVLDEVAVALGGTNANDLETLVANGVFTPVFSAPADSGVTFSAQEGYYRRIGSVVDVDVHVAWTATEALLETVDVAIVPPYAVDAASAIEFVGAVRARGFDDGTQSLVAPVEAVIPTSPLVIKVFDSADTAMVYGLSEARAVRLQVRYRTDGVFAY
jgi:hypothetical protein